MPPKLSLLSSRTTPNALHPAAQEAPSCLAWPRRPDAEPPGRRHGHLWRTGTQRKGSGPGKSFFLKKENAFAEEPPVFRALRGKPARHSKSISPCLSAGCFRFQRGRIPQSLPEGGRSLGLPTAPHCRRPSSFPQPTPKLLCCPPQPAPTVPTSTSWRPSAKHPRGLLSHPARGALFQTEVQSEIMSSPSPFFLIKLFCVSTAPPFAFLPS